MCGFAGIIGEISNFDIANEIGLPHRGPDFSSTIYDNNLFVIANRLAISDFNAGSNQPMKSECGQYILCFNGEIYNHKVLQSIVKDDYGFRTNCDTEVLFALLIKEGVQAVKRLRGIFSFAFINLKEQKTYLIRDQFGVKPLYFTKQGDTILFASEISWIRKKIKNISINNKAFTSLLKYGYNVHDETFVKEIRSVTHASIVVFDMTSKEVTSSSYYKTTFHKKATLSTKEIFDRIRNSIIRQSYSDSGILLSGGLDSSILYKSIDTKKSYTVDTGMLYSSDIEFALKIDSNVDVLKIEENKVDLFRTFIKALDQPNLDTAAFNTFVISIKAKADNLKVLFSGIGADDIFGGYRRHLNFGKVLKLAKLPLPIKSVFFSFLKFIDKKHPLLKFKKQITNFKGNTRRLVYSLYENTQYHDLFGMLNNDFDSLCELEYEPVGENYLNQLLSLEQNVYLPKNLLPVADNMTMANGIELRVPFLDQDIVYAANDLNESDKRAKKILKEFATGWIPKEIINRKKTGFGTPPNVIFEPNFFMELFKDLNFAIFKKESVFKLLDKYKKGENDSVNSLYAIAVVESWVACHL